MARQGGEIAQQYAVRISKKARKGLDSLVGNRKADAEEFLNQVAPFTPKTRIAGKTKKLRGAYARKGLLQYDLPDGYRIQYWVLDEPPTVFVDYIGPHPK